MPKEPSTLEVLVRVPTEAEANLIVQSLADRDISARAIGGFTSGFQAEAPGDVAVLVRRGDLARAKNILAAAWQDRSFGHAADNAADQPARRAENRGEEAVAFLCEECGENIMFPAERCGYTETCPHCGSYVDVPESTEVPLPVKSTTAASEISLGKSEQPEGAVSGLRTSNQLWIEVFAVLCFAYIPDLFAAISIAVGWFQADYPPVPGMLLLIIRSLAVSMPLLVIVSLSKDPWPLFGIVRPRWIIDGLGGCLIYFGCLVAYAFAISLLPPSMLESSALPQAAHRTGSEGIVAFILALAAWSANGFAEELVMRGYLIARLERLLRSTWQAVLVSTLLFASYHLYQGPIGAIGAATFGLVCAVSFCIFRRLWPLCVAHALWNLWLI